MMRKGSAVKSKSAEAVGISYWQCRQNPDHVFDNDDWRIQPTNEMNARRWFRAFCCFDGRELEKKSMEVK